MTRNRQVRRHRRKQHALALSISALALAAALAPVAQAGVEAQHNETLVVV